MNKRIGEFLPFGWMVGIDPTLWSDYLVAYLDTNQEQSSAASLRHTSSSNTGRGHRPITQRDQSENHPPAYQK